MSSLWDTLSSVVMNMAFQAKQRLARCILHRTIGQFLKHKLQLRQIEINANGSFNFVELELDEEGLNEYTTDLPFEFVSGRVDKVSGTVPYMNLLSEGCELKMEGLDIVLRRKSAKLSTHAAMDLLASSFTDMTESIAREYSEDPNIVDGEMEGPGEDLQSLTYLIQTVLSKMRAECKNIRVRLEDYSAELEKTVALVISLNDVEFHDTTLDTIASTDAQPDGQEPDPVTAPTSEKQIQFSGFTVDLEVSDGRPETASEENTRSTRIAVGNSNSKRPDVVNLRMHRQKEIGRPSIEATVFAHSLHALLSPEQCWVLSGLAAFFSPLAEEDDDANGADETSDGIQVKVTVRQGLISFLHDNLSQFVHSAVAARFFQSVQINAQQPDCTREHMRVAFSHMSFNFLASDDGSNRIGMDMDKVTVHECVQVQQGEQVVRQEFNEVMSFQVGLDRAVSQLGSENAFPAIRMADPAAAGTGAAGADEPQPHVQLTVDTDAAGNTNVVITLAPAIMALDLTLADRLQSYICLSDIAIPKTLAKAKTGSAADAESGGRRRDNRQDQPGTTTGTAGAKAPSTTAVRVNAPLLRLHVVSPIPSFGDARPANQRPLGRPLPFPHRQQSLCLDLLGVSLSTNPRISEPIFMNLSVQSELGFLFYLADGKTTAPSRALPVARFAASHAAHIAIDVTARRVGAAAAADEDDINVFSTETGPLRAAQLCDLDMARALSFRRSRYAVDIRFPTTAAALDHNTFQAVYEIITDLGMWEPWEVTTNPKQWFATFAATQPQQPQQRQHRHHRQTDDDDETFVSASEATDSDEDAETPTPTPTATAAGNVRAANSSDDDDSSDDDGDGEARGGGARARPPAASSSSSLSSAAAAVKSMGHLAAVQVTFDEIDLELVDPVVEGDYEALAVALQQLSIFSALSVAGRAQKLVHVSALDGNVYEVDAAHVRHLIGRHSKRAPDRPLLRLGVDMTLQERVQRKTITVAGDVEYLHLVHRCSQAGRHWLFRAIDFTNTTDPDYQGYTPPARVIALNLHFWSLALEYRPLYRPMVALITADCLRLGTNIVPASPMLVLSFVFQDTRLFLIDDPYFLNRVDSDDPVQLGYAQMMHEAALSLEVKTCSDGSQPSLHVAIGNQHLEVTACLDSLLTLIRTFRYYFAAVDLEPEALVRAMIQQQDGATAVNEPAVVIGADLAAVAEQPEAAQSLAQPQPPRQQQASQPPPQQQPSSAAAAQAQRTQAQAQQARAVQAVETALLAASGAAEVYDDLDPLTQGTTRHDEDGDEDESADYLHRSFYISANSDMWQSVINDDDDEDARPGRTVTDLSATCFYEAEEDADDAPGQGTGQAHQHVSAAAVTAPAVRITPPASTANRASSVSATTGTASSASASGPASGAAGSAPASSSVSTSSLPASTGAKASTSSLPGKVDDQDGAVQMLLDLAEALEDKPRGASALAGAARSQPIDVPQQLSGGARRQLTSLARSGSDASDGDGGLFFDEDYLSVDIDDSSSLDEERAMMLAHGRRVRQRLQEESAELNRYREQEQQELQRQNSERLQRQLSERQQQHAAGAISDDDDLDAEILQHPAHRESPEGPRHDQSNGTVRRLSSNRITVKQDHFKIPQREIVDIKKIDPRFPRPEDRITVSNVNVTLRLCVGSDWAGRQAKLERVSFGRGEGDASDDDDDEDDIEDEWDLFRDNLRKADESVEIVIRGLNVSSDTFPEQATYSDRLLVLVRQFEILDKLRESQINKFLSDYWTTENPRETGSHMIRFEHVLVRSASQQDHIAEAMMGLSILPLRLNIDQDALNFLVFHAVGLAAVTAEEFVIPDPAPDAPGQSNQDDETYYKIAVVDPLVAKIDYVPKRVRFSKLFQGELAELAGLVYLSGAFLCLDKLVAKGVRGPSRLVESFGEQVLVSIKTKQIPRLVGGVPVVRPVVSVASAGLQLLREPVQQFPHVVHGVSDGLFFGVQTTAVEVCNIATTLTFALQSALELTQGLVSREDEARIRVDRSRFGTQPAGAMAGMAQARHVLLDSMRSVYRDVLQKPFREHGQRTGPATALIRTLGALPRATLHPLIALCEATSLSLQGIRNSLHPDSKRDLETKYKAF